MTIKPLEEHETDRWLNYKHNLTELVSEFKSWVSSVEEKYLNEEEIKTLMNQISEDGRYIVSFDLEKLLGKK